jgi:ligand-binding sensor domain-containing protein
VSLSPNIVLNDFVPANQTTYVSQSGGFSETDVYFVLVNGERTTLNNYVDPVRKSVVFASPVASGTQVSLEIRGREEVQGTLNVSKFGPLDASQVTTGDILEPQLPRLSHEGRVRERAYPASYQLTSTNGYEYEATKGTLGSATTPYAIAQNKDNNLLFGTSAGLLRTFVSGLVLGQDDTLNVTSNTPIVSSEQFQEDQLVETAVNAKKTSGRISGTVTLTKVHVGGIIYPSVNLVNPSGCLLEDGRVFLCGGSQSKDSYVYDPVTHESTKMAQMSVCRVFHACTRMPNGTVLVTGGQDDTKSSYTNHPENFPNGTAILRYLQSFEVFSPFIGSWTTSGNMKQARYNHASIVLDESNLTSDVLIAGGAWAYVDPSVAGNFRYDEVWEQYTDRDFYQYEDLESSEIYAIGPGFRYTDTFMNHAFQVAAVQMDRGLAVVDGPKYREIYSPGPETWQEGQAPSNEPFVGVEAIDGPIKQFLVDDANDSIFAVTKANVFVSKNGGGYWGKMKGLDAVGTVHRIAMDSNQTLYAATDLGVYEMTLDGREAGVWFQGGLIGAGTTETFDLFSFDPSGSEHGMFAATEIGLFYSNDGGETWSNPDSLPYGSRGISVDDVYNIESLGGNLFIQAGQDIYKSTDGGLAWTRTAILPFADSNSKLVARQGLDMFLATSSGLYVTFDGTTFSLVNYNINRNGRVNNIHMADLLGSDLVVGYDNLALMVGPDYSTQVLAAWTGTVPTVSVNGSESRSGFRYDTKNSVIVFENKRLSDDVVTLSSNYSLYNVAGGGWYAQNPDTTVLVYVNDKEHSATFDSRLGQVAFSSPLSKSDVVTVSIAATTLRDGGMYFHTELEDNLSRAGGLPLYLERDHACNLLQMGISTEHNYLERGRLRTEYCDIDGLVDRSLNSFLPYSDFVILGRKEFDRFNSTIDYHVESSQADIGKAALVCNAILEMSSSELWLGTDRGVFVVDPSASYEVSETFDIGPVGNSILCFYPFPYPDSNSVWAATTGGLFTVTPGLSGRTVAKNLGAGLPGAVHAMAAVNNVMAAGTDDGIYYTDETSDPSYGIWLKASFSASGAEVFVTTPCTSMVVKDGTVFAAVSDSLYRSTNGKEWERVYSFSDGTLIVTMSVFANKLFLGTTAGIYNDNSTAKANTVTFSLEPVYDDPDTDESLHVNDMFATLDSLYAVGSFPTVLTRKNELWTKQAVGVTAIHKIAVLSGGGKVAVSNNLVLVG